MIFKYLKCIFGFGTVYDDSICKFSEKFYDIHDYRVDKGGDGLICHFKYFKCWKCGKYFTI